MASPELLNELADIHLPGPVSSWPPAYGWWILAALIITVVILTLRSFVVAQIRRKRMRSALRELDKVYKRFRRNSASSQSGNHPGLEFLYGVNSTLRRVALLHYPQNLAINHLRGKAWLEFLDSCDTPSDIRNRLGKNTKDLLNISNTDESPAHNSTNLSTEFTNGVGQALGERLDEGLYEHYFNTDAKALYALARQWIKRRYHKPRIHLTMLQIDTPSTASTPTRLRS